ncbi:MAG: hypothetical protein AB8F74_18305 [Saprospiraceae bacterium]
MKTISYLFLILLTVSCSHRIKLKEAYTPNIRAEVNQVLSQIKNARLEDILVDRTGKVLLDVSEEETKELIKAAITGDKATFDSLRNYEAYKKEAERVELINKIKPFKKAHLTVLKYYTFSTKLCDDNSYVEKWTLKEDRDKNLIEYVKFTKYYDLKKSRRSVSYTVITRKGSPNKIEILSDRFGYILGIDNEVVKVNSISLGVEYSGDIRKMVRECY